MATMGLLSYANNYLMDDIESDNQLLLEERDQKPSFLLSVTFV